MQTIKLGENFAFGFADEEDEEKRGPKWKGDHYLSMPAVAAEWARNVECGGPLVGQL